MLGVRAFGGRVFTPDDDKPAAPPVAVLSHRVWQTSYGSDPSVVGSTFIVEGHPFTVIGVAPPGFFGETLRSDPPDIWIPVQQEPLIDGEGDAAAPVRVRMAAHDRPPAAGSFDCTEWRRASPECCGNGCSMIPGIPPTGCRT